MGEKYTHLTLDERKQIYRLLADGRSQKHIARALGRNPSCISRELRRNSSEDLGYLPDSAASLSQKRRTKVGSKIERSKHLQKTIENYLAMDWSPERIAGRLELESDKQTISHESIYKWIYGPGKHKNLHHYLLRKKRKRGQRPSRKVDKSKIPNRISIHERPESYKEQFGHWECDTVHFAGHKGGILTIYEKTTKLTLGAKMHTLKSDETIDYIKTILERLPQKARLSGTFDNGSEFTNHQQLKENLGLETYFCDPYASWQKGGVENANGILRRYVPKGSRADEHTAEDIQKYLQGTSGNPKPK